MNININGLPLFRSSNVQLWPILGSRAELAKADVFVSGLFAGSSKPSNITIFLQDFVFEMTQLLRTGINYLDHHYAVDVNALICDVPTRSFVKFIKGHGDYNACERCMQEGVYADRTMMYLELHGRLRTDVDFTVQRNEEHHLHNLTSPLLELNVGLVSKCPLDYMHLICLGVVSRIVSLWLQGSLQYRLPARIVNDI